MWFTYYGIGTVQALLHLSLGCHMPSGYEKSNDYGGPEPDRRLLILGAIAFALSVWFLIGD